MDAYVIVYAVTNKESYRTACNILYQIRSEPNLNIAVILVANKTDLVRFREVSEEGIFICFSIHSKNVTWFMRFVKYSAP